MYFLNVFSLLWTQDLVWSRLVRHLSLSETRRHKIGTRFKSVKQNEEQNRPMGPAWDVLTVHEVSEPSSSYLKTFEFSSAPLIVCCSFWFPSPRLLTGTVRNAQSFKRRLTLNVCDNRRGRTWNDPVLRSQRDSLQGLVFLSSWQEGCSVLTSIQSLWRRRRRSVLNIHPALYHRPPERLITFTWAEARSADLRRFSVALTALLTRSTSRLTAALLNSSRGLRQPEGPTTSRGTDGPGRSEDVHRTGGVTEKQDGKKRNQNRFKLL